MESIIIQQSFEEAYRQDLFVENLLFQKDFKSFKNNFYSVAFLAVILIIIDIFSDTQFIGLYIVLGIWFSIVFVGGFSLQKFYRQRKREAAESIKKTQREIPSVSLKYNSEGMIYTYNHTTSDLAQNVVSEIKWSYYNTFLKDGNTLFLFRENLREYVSFSDKELSSDHLSALEMIVREKLPELELKK